MLSHSVCSPRRQFLFEERVFIFVECFKKIQSYNKNNFCCSEQLMGRNDQVRWVEVGGEWMEAREGRKWEKNSLDWVEVFDSLTRSSVRRPGLAKEQLMENAVAAKWRGDRLECSSRETGSAIAAAGSQHRVQMQEKTCNGWLSMVCGSSQ
jgi:hypothetical protein